MVTHRQEVLIGFGPTFPVFILGLPKECEESVPPSKQGKEDLPHCEEGGTCHKEGRCGFCTGARHRMLQDIEPFLPGMEIQRDFFQ